VRFTVDLDAKSGARAEEIDDGSADHLLATELESFELRIRQVPPQALLRLGWIVAHFAGAPVQFCELFG
jgi:hypothetical protein